jgi:hypothetical protein
MFDEEKVIAKALLLLANSKSEQDRAAVFSFVKALLGSTVEKELREEYRLLVESQSGLKKNGYRNENYLKEVVVACSKKED